MVLRISKTGAIYYDEEQVQGQRHPATCPNIAIALEPLEPDRYALVASAGSAQLGWCIKGDDGWSIEDMSSTRVAGPFRSLASARVAAQRLLAHEAGTSTPGW